MTSLQRCRRSTQMVVRPHMQVQCALVALYLSSVGAYVVPRAQPAMRMRTVSMSFGSKAVKFVSSVAACVLIAGSASADSARMYGLSSGGRLLGCPKTGNCVSTSAVNSIERYSTPWSYGELSAEEAWKQLVSAISAYDLLHIVEQDDAKFYLRAEARSAVPPTGVDDVEFLLSPANKVVTYRSSSREGVRIGPAVLPDGGSNRNRLNTLRSKLGWQKTIVEEESSQQMEKEIRMPFMGRLQGPQVDVYE